MKLPRSVIIAGRPWPVVFDKAIVGAEWSSNPGVIRIGPHKSDEEQVIFFIHEILEAILTQRLHRYDSYPDEKCQLFFVDHREFSNVVRDLYQAIKPLLRLGGPEGNIFKKHGGNR